LEFALHTFDDGGSHKSHSSTQVGHTPRSAHPEIIRGVHAEHQASHKPDVASDAAPTLTFADLGLSAPLLHALRDEKYEVPTPIQAKAIVPVLAGRDVLGCAQTGTGKTAAFALPILHLIHAQPADKSRRGPTLPRVLVLSPTRELATQIAESFATYGRHTGLTHTTIFGGVSQHHQVKALHRGVDILVATPGRLIDLMEQRHVNLSQVQMLVLDEADRMLDMGFIKPIQRIAAALPKPRQTLLFSATMPREIQHLADSMLHDPVKVSVAHNTNTAALIEQSLYYIHRQQKQALLHHLLETLKVERAVVFTKTKHGADKVCKKLSLAGVRAQAIHGNKAQNQRTRALESFSSGRSRVLVATDVAARGLDVEGITHVFNFDLPMEPEAYVHRIGRTGRAGATGAAISFCDAEERGLLKDIERLTSKRIPVTPTPVELPEVASFGPGVHEERDGEPRRAPRDQFRPQHRGERSAPHTGAAHTSSSHPRERSAGAHHPKPAHSDTRDGAPKRPQSGGHSHGGGGGGGGSHASRPPRSMGNMGRSRGKR
jgi:ATP-dependent RNA helicase RhlE